MIKQNEIADGDELVVYYPTRPALLAFVYIKTVGEDGVFAYGRTFPSTAGFDIFIEYKMIFNNDSCVFKCTQLLKLLY